MRTGQLPRVGVSIKDVSGAVFGPIDLGYLRRRRIPDQLQQGDAAVLWMGEKTRVRPKYKGGTSNVRQEGCKAGYSVRPG